MIILAVISSGRSASGAGVQESVSEATWCVQWAAGPGVAGPPLSASTCFTGQSGLCHAPTTCLFQPDCESVNILHVLVGADVACNNTKQHSDVLHQVWPLS